MTQQLGREYEFLSILTCQPSLAVTKADRSSGDREQVRQMEQMITHAIPSIFMVLYFSRPDRHCLPTSHAFTSTEAEGGWYQT